MFKIRGVDKWAEVEDRMANIRKTRHFIFYLVKSFIKFVFFRNIIKYSKTPQTIINPLNQKDRESIFKKTTFCKNK